MLRRRRVADRRGANSSRHHPTGARRAHPRPTTLRLRAGAEQRRDCVGWLRPTVAHAFPTLERDTAVQPAIRAASDVCGVRTGRGRYHDDVWVPRIDRHAAQVADLETGARRAPRRAGVVALEISIAGGDAQGIGSVGMNGELVGVPRSTRKRGRAMYGHHRSWIRARRPRSRPRVVRARAGGTRSIERDACPVSAEMTIPTTSAVFPSRWSAPTYSRHPRAPYFARLGARPDHVPL